MKNAHIAIAATCTALLSILSVTAPQAVAARTKTCADHNGQLYAFEKSVRVWHDESSLRSCIVSGRGRKSSRRFMRLGSWSEGTRLVGVNQAAVWLAPVRDAQGRPTGAERIWARSLFGGPMLLAGIRAQRLSFGAPVDAVVSAITWDGALLAWTSGDGAYVVGVGEGYEVSSVPGGQQLEGGGAGKVVQLGNWPGKATQLAKTLTIGSDEGDGDDCGWVRAAPVTVTPDTTPVGVSMMHGSSNPACN